MSVYELPHVTVTPKANGGMFLIQADEGWCIHLPEHDEGVYKRSVGLPATYDFSTVQIIDVNTLPEGAEVTGDDEQPEVM